MINWFVDYSQGRFESALERTESWPDIAMMLEFAAKELALAMTYEKMGRSREAGRAYEDSVALLLEHLEHDERNAFARSQLALAYAGLGHKEDAIREAGMAADIVPLSRDAVDGPGYIENLAKIYLRVGETEKALDLLDQLLSIPADVTVPLIEIDLDWQALDDHPRYREILNKYR